MTAHSHLGDLAVAPGISALEARVAALEARATALEAEALKVILQSGSVALASQTGEATVYEVGFTASGRGTAYAQWSYSGFATAGGLYGTKLYVDGVLLGQSFFYFNAINTHETFPWAVSSLGKLSAAAHTLKIVTSTGLMNDSGDHVSVLIVEA